MITLIAEKPDAGMNLARITGCKNRRDGYMDGGFLGSEPCRVTWSYGHLLQLDEEEGTKALHWKADNLPVIPSPFLLSPRKGKDHKADAGCMRQLKIIKSLFETSDTIVNCGDAGREGEVIQRWIAEYTMTSAEARKKKMLRLWISSLTDEAIREGLRNLRPASEFDGLYQAGRARAEADWLVGINATEALTLLVRKNQPYSKKTYSLGRVQTPTLALVCARYLENKSFKPEPFWTVRLHTKAKGVTFHVDSTDKFKDFGKAESLRKRASVSILEVTSAEHKQKTVQPPLLHDQTSLQQEASKRYDMDPIETLAIAQKLYESKLITYPRTGSCFIPHDVLRTVPSRLRNIADCNKNPKIRTAAARMTSPDAPKLNMRSVNDGKVTDHHALLVETTKLPELTEKEMKIYNLIAERMLEAFGEPALQDVYSCRFTCADQEFSASSTTTVKPGWKGVRGEAAPSPEAVASKDGTGEEPPQKLPELKEGDNLPVDDAETIQGMTKPKPLYTNDTLLEAMKKAGRESDDDEIKAALKDIGLGTSATRAAILNRLINGVNYMKKQSQKIIPTETGLEVYQLVKDMSIANVALTGEWEIKLAAIEEGNISPQSFRQGIEEYTHSITAELLNMQAGSGLAQAAEAEDIHCPLCGSVVKVWDNNAKCTNKECGLTMGRIICGKKLAPITIKRFLENGKTGLIKGFTSKTGKSFDARLKLAVTEKEGRKYANAEFVFEDRKPNNKKPWNK